MTVRATSSRGGQTLRLPPAVVVAEQHVRCFGALHAVIAPSGADVHRQRNYFEITAITQDVHRVIDGCVVNGDRRQPKIPQVVKDRDQPVCTVEGQQHHSHLRRHRPVPVEGPFRYQAVRIAIDWNAVDLFEAH